MVHYKFNFSRYLERNDGMTERLVSFKNGFDLFENGQDHNFFAEFANKLCRIFFVEILKVSS